MRALRSVRDHVLLHSHSHSHFSISVLLWLYRATERCASPARQPVPLRLPHAPARTPLPCHVTRPVPPPVARALLRLLRLLQVPV